MSDWATCKILESSNAVAVLFSNESSKYVGDGGSSILQG